MGDEPMLVMPVGVDSYEMNINIISPNYKNQGLRVLLVAFR